MSSSTRCARTTRRSSRSRSCSVRRRATSATPPAMVPTSTPTARARRHRPEPGPAGLVPLQAAVRVLGRLRRALVAGTATVALLAAGGCGVIGGDQKTITAHFTDSIGLFPGNHVDVLGVPIGTVTKVEPQGTSVAVTMRIPSDVKVPANAGALIIPPTVITDRYVELTPV